MRTRRRAGCWILLLVLQPLHGFKPTSSQPRLRSGTSRIGNGIPRDEVELHNLETLLVKAGMNLSDCIVDDLRGQGYCNYMYMIQNKEQKLVAKLLSNLAKRRIHPTSNFKVDLLTGKSDVGPRVHATTSNGVIMDYVDGHVLNETIIHGAEDDNDNDNDNDNNNDHLIKTIAERVKILHRKLEYPPSPPNILWHSLDVMLSMIGDSSDLAGRLREQCQFHKECLEPLDLPQVLGHGDLKPSNIMLSGEQVLFIDFETSGMHYRGFDIAKIFRTRNPTRKTERLKRIFAATYAESEIDSESVLLEAALLTPMTWLEAAVFFVCSSFQDSSDAEKWTELAIERLRHYDECMSNHKSHIEAYKQHRWKD